ncbi:MAG: hypothetical protein IJV11_01015 [Muribaculaceae bacterium]|nr:hypothetical protein [Muribaculaceae bacterium]
MEIEDRNGSLTLTHTAALPPLDELSWQIAAVGIIGLYRLAGGMIMLHSVFFQEREAVWVSVSEPFFSFLFIYY